MTNLKSASEGLIDSDAPLEIRNLARFGLITALIFEENYRAALDQIEMRRLLDDPPPILYWLEGDVLAGLERYEESNRAYEFYVDLLGVDTDSREAMADNFLMLGDEPKAAALALEAIEKDSRAAGCFATLAAATPAEELEGLGSFVKSMEDPELCYEFALDYLIELDQQGKSIAMLAMFRKDFPESELLEYYDEFFDAEGSAE